MSKYFSEYRLGDVTEIKIELAELSIDKTDKVRAELKALVSDKINKFMIDMADCGYIPSVALGILIAFNKYVRENNGKVVFWGLTEQGKSIFRITKLDNIFEIYDTQDQALGAFVASPKDEGESVWR